jgi:uncharacterized protein YhbP (UPF0306 family)
MNQKDFEKASQFWTDKDKTSKKMERSDILRAADDFLKTHNTCALATGSGTFVRCTPIEYTYTDGVFYMFSEGGLKFRALAENSRVCMAVFDQYVSMGSLKGIQITGTASMVEPFSPEYLKILAVKKIPVQALKQIDYTMNLIKIVPSRIDMLNSDFKKNGFDSRQFVEL